MIFVGDSIEIKMEKMIISKLQKSVLLLRKRIDRCWKSAQRVHLITGENKTKLFVEIVYSWFRYGCSDEDFLTMEFYRKNSREKKRWLTSRKNNRYLYRTVYDDLARETFDNKEIFDKTFKKYLKHDFLILSESSDEEILSFTKKYGTVIVKPAGGACGMGIFKLSFSDKSGINEVISRVRDGENLSWRKLLRNIREWLA